MTIDILSVELVSQQQVKIRVNILESGSIRELTLEFNGEYLKRTNVADAIKNAALKALELEELVAKYVNTKIYVDTDDTPSIYGKKAQG